MGFNFGFFGTPEHRVFNYRPRYYDEEKEELRKKFGHVDGTNDKEPYVPGSIIKGSFRDGNYQRTRSQSTKVQKFIGMFGLILFFVVLLYITKFYNLLWEWM